jgi:hypothetical protein
VEPVDALGAVARVSVDVRPSPNGEDLPLVELVRKSSSSRLTAESAFTPNRRRSRDPLMIREFDNDAF